MRALTYILICCVVWIPSHVLWMILDSPLKTADVSAVQIYVARAMMFMGYLAINFWWSGHAWRINQTGRIRRQ